jgi:TldD protein
MNVLLEQSLVGVYIHEAFGHASEGDAILANRSVLRNQIGNQMAIGGVNVIDDPTLAGYRGSFKYDSEGTPTSKRDIIKDGKLVGYLNDLQTASMLDQGNILNGSARATDFRHMTMPRMGNTYIDNGELSLEELLQEIGDGVYLTYSNGGFVNPSTGEFYFSSQSGFKIENGELTTPIRNSGMSGMTLEVLQNTLGVGNDLMIDAFPGVCGKGNLTGFQPMPVTGGGPTIAAKDIIVGGK